ncbi:MAG: hypothetical protein KBD50_02010 [Candidatus Pacebacteria bacterium]|nr:hypothetical protein [Candidatus Paceibacterota bacterium]
MTTKRAKLVRLPPSQRSFTEGERLQASPISLDDFDGGDGMLDHDYEPLANQMYEQYGQEPAGKPQPLTKIFR